LPGGTEENHNGITELLVVSISVSYLGKTGLKCLAGDRVSSVRLFRDFPEYLQPKAAILPKCSSVLLF
jgi:hypothetical protein